MVRSLDAAIAERARSTLGLLTFTQLDALGVSRQRRRTLVSNGVLTPVSARVVRHAAVAPSWEQTVLAAVLAAGTGAVASHMSAAALWRFDGIARGAVEVTVLRGRQPRAVPGTVHRTLDFGPADVEPGRVPRTTPARTICDIAARLAPARLEAVLDHAEMRNQIWRPQLRWRLDGLRRQGRPGIPALVGLLDRTEGRPLGDSWLEQEAIRLVTHSGLPWPRVQVKLRKRAGSPRKVIARVDLFWDDVRLVAELAGQGTHATRRDRQAGAERAARLGLERWRVVEFTYEDVVERPHYVVQTLRSYLAQAE
ncbi:MAG: hypothetical protein ACRDZN_15895 [Acidimicrobiales bacterium]